SLFLIYYTSFHTFLEVPFTVIMTPAATSPFLAFVLGSYKLKRAVDLYVTFGNFFLVEHESLLLTFQ
ncbi:hypothetical protein, partial [Pseudolactococcus raffinolactis]|uniref:hypothetical protein n=1 Tax=Pseudolactococcus raffinolactis TaxID=1366 RepID=UPI001C70ACAC